MINFEEGTLIKGAYVVVNGEELPVHMPEYSGNTPMSPENLNKIQLEFQKEQMELQKELTSVSKLIYSKVVGTTEINGFTITDVVFKEGKQYKIIVDGAINGPTDDTQLYNVIARLNNETPSICRSSVFGTIKTGTTDGIQNAYSTAEYLRLLRGYISFGCLSEIQLTYRSYLIRALGQYACFGSADDRVINQQIATMLGRYSGDITKIEISPSDSKVTIAEGTIIKILELP